jgi:hypothetical protein
MSHQPVANLRGVLLQSRDPLRLLRRARGFHWQRIRGAMPGEDLLCGRFQLRRLALKVGARSAAPLRRVARQLHAVDGEHLAPDQPFRIANRQHRPEDARDVVAERTHELRDGGEMGRLVPAERDKRHVLAAGLLDSATANNAVGVGGEDHLEEQRRRIRGGPRRVIAKARIEGREIDRVIEQVIQRVLEGAGEKLPRQVDGQELGIGIDVLVAGHEDGGWRKNPQGANRAALHLTSDLHVRRSFDPELPDEFRSATMIPRLFLQPQRRAVLLRRIS